MKNAFTMIELIIVIIVAGILATVALPKMDENNLNEAIDQVASHIRYTQHLAMQDNRFDPSDPGWFKERWQILFHTNSATKGRFAYTIFSDRVGVHSGNPEESEIAKNPSNSKQLLTGGHSSPAIDADDKRTTKALDLGKKYGIKDMVFGGACSILGRRVSFDNFGRPMRGNLRTYTSPYPANRLITQQCTISLCTQNPCPASDERQIRRTIAIEPETGYVHVLPL